MTSALDGVLPEPAVNGANGERINFNGLPIIPAGISIDCTFHPPNSIGLFFANYSG